MAHSSQKVRLRPASKTPAERVSMTFERFASLSAASGVLLLAVTVVAMVWANSPLAHIYHYLFEELTLSVTLGSIGWSAHTVHWINDLLMAVFFFMVGLEIKREVLFGELSSVKRAALPLIAALGGMIAPGTIYALINRGGDGMHGWGIPTATDIAFALGVMALLGSRIPTGLRVFLTTLAVADDLGALLVIAIFYTDSPNLTNLLIAGGALLVMFIMNRAGVRWPVLYLIVGGVVWWFIHHSGVHATIAGVVTAMSIPSRSREDLARFALFARESAQSLEKSPHQRGALLSGDQQEVISGIEDACEKAQSPMQRLEHSLVPWVSFLIVPLFALANAGVPLATGDTSPTDLLRSPECLGVALGLLLGKPIGIFVASFIGVKLGLGALPSGVTFKHVHGAAWLGGIGFTMSLFIASLAFVKNGAPDPAQLNAAKIGILLGSAVAAIVGLVLLARAAPARES